MLISHRHRIYAGCTTCQHCFLATKFRPNEIIYFTHTRQVKKHSTKHVSESAWWSVDAFQQIHSYRNTTLCSHLSLYNSLLAMITASLPFKFEVHYKWTLNVLLQQKDYIIIFHIYMPPYKLNNKIPQVVWWRSLRSNDAANICRLRNIFLNEDVAV